MRDLYHHPEVLALLQDARERPEEDGPRLVLADFLDDHGDPARAEFIRLQCQLAPAGQPAPSRQELKDGVNQMTALLARFGGGWAGPLWEWGGGMDEWQRGLLSLHLRRRLVPFHLEDILPWVDAVLLEAWSWQGLEQAVHFLNATAFNHVVLELRRPLLEEGIIAHLAEVRESACLRTLTVGWHPQAWRPHSTRTQGTEGVVGLGERFFARLALDLPLGRHLTHFASRRPLLSVLAQACLKEAGIKVLMSCCWRWPAHTLPHSTFRRQSRCSPSEVNNVLS